MKIVISTFNNSNNNYGALFQACGLSAFLREMGYETYNVSLAERKQKKQSKIILMKIWLKKLILLPMKKAFRRREKLFREFREKTQNQLHYATPEQLYADPPQADVYISGSDQVWNPVAMHRDLFLAYAPQNSRKIAYAASMGAENIPEENKELFAQYIGQYAAVSVREDTVADIVAPYTKCQVQQHIDPVFLKNREQWQQLEQPYPGLRFSKYIFAYIIEWNEGFNKQLKALKEQTGLPVVSVNIGNLKKICADQVIYDASPEAFLHLLHNSEMVVATSFHGVAMSVVYNKPFLPLTGSNMPTRIQSLMRHFDIDITKSISFTEADFARINAQIQQDRICAREYLRAAIEGGE